MVVKVYVSGISGNKEVKKRQQRVLMILDSKTIKYEIIDIAEPGNESDKDFMQNNSKSNGGTVSDPNPRHALPPQLFNDEDYCGDYDQFDLANELDTLEQFLKVEAPSENNVDETKQANNVGEKKEDIKEDKNDEEKTAETSVEPEKEKSEDAKADIETKESIEAASNIVDEDSKVDVVEIKDDETKEISPASVQEGKSDERVKSEEREVIPEKKLENNGVASSREPSVENKVTEPENTALESLKDADKSPSEALIESQKLAAE